MPLLFMFQDNDGKPIVDEHPIKPGDGKRYMRENAFAGSSIIYAFECDRSDEYSKVWESTEPVEKGPDDHLERLGLKFVKELRNMEYMDIKVVSPDNYKCNLRVGHSTEKKHGRA